MQKRIVLLSLCVLRKLLSDLGLNLCVLKSLMVRLLIVSMVIVNILMLIVAACQLQELEGSIAVLPWVSENLYLPP